jgi:flagellar basal-body rod modification protein FlgD
MTTAVRNTFSSPVFNTSAEPPVGAAEPSAPRTLPTNANAMGRDEFLKMLVAQLKNQDPLNPMDGKDMAAQLAQFSTVEQLIQMNKTLEGQQSRDGEIIEAITKLEESQNRAPTNSRS